MEKLNLDLFILIQQQKHWEISYWIDNRVNEGSAWVVELIEFQYINISTCRPLLGSSYLKLPVELRSPKKGLINIKNKDQKCFWWCFVRRINAVEIHPERIAKEDKKIANDLDLMGLSFLCKKIILAKLRQKTTFALTRLVMKMGWLFQFTFQIKFENSMNLLLLIDHDKSHYLYIKDFNRFTQNKK